MSSRLPQDSSRRASLASILVLVFISVFVMSIAGCRQGSTTGPGTIHWDRETCEHCQMVISDRRHAVQIRLLGDRRTHAFDDLGCGLLWLDQRGLRAGGENGPEIWVKDSKAGDWLDGRSADFEAGLTTPMAYGFGVSEGGLSLAEVQNAILETERRRRSPVAKQMDHEPHQKDMHEDTHEDEHQDTKGKDVD
jgi:copper chaperone NosL